MMRKGFRFLPMALGVGFGLGLWSLISVVNTGQPAATPSEGPLPAATVQHLNEPHDAEQHAAPSHGTQEMAAAEEPGHAAHAEPASPTSDHAHTAAEAHAIDHAPAEAHGHGGHGHAPSEPFPKVDAHYAAAEAALAAELGKDKLSLGETLWLRATSDPINVVATLMFLLAIGHTFVAGKFMHIAHKVEHEHEEMLRKQHIKGKRPVSMKASIYHFLGEVEAIFGIWLVPLLLIITLWKGWHTTSFYIDTRNYVEPMFVVVIMAIASSLPVIKFAESALSKLAGLGKHSPAAWWLSILTIAPLLGSFITEPAAMTIAALLLGHQFYQLNPSPKFKYATLGLLFVNISVGGTLTHFAAPPVLMVANTWEWNMPFMLTNFGWRAVMGIVLSNILYYFLFKKEFAQIKERASLKEDTEDLNHDGVPDAEQSIPVWITLTHLCFLGWTVFTLHHPAMFLFGFLVFLAFTHATAHHQEDIKLKGPLLVGFFLAGLVTHGGLQGWWISPVLSSLSEVPLFTGATILTAFNDNAAITFLASQVPAFGNSIDGSAILQYAVVAGAVTGGGLTVIANAPNPAGQSILGRFFQGGVAPLGLLLGALIPTLIMAACFMLIPH